MQTHFIFTVSLMRPWVSLHNFSSGNGGRLLKCSVPRICTWYYEMCLPSSSKDEIVTKKQLLWTVLLFSPSPVLIFQTPVHLVWSFKRVQKNGCFTLFWSLLLTRWLIKSQIQEVSGENWTLTSCSYTMRWDVIPSNCWILNVMTKGLALSPQQRREKGDG